MLTKIIEIRQNQIKLPELISLLQENEEIVITDGHIPVARLTSINDSGSRTPDLYPHSIIISEDFDESLSDEFWLGEE
ncbi:type II toxin-antitoxin system Phd/YefM family antitoxin [Aphanothece sacrum]|uniref:Prevent-host-death family protein n=1 Tax=Aphanothece sacrum FPU1 TaxID=1920663 RepID=A0A401IJX4_APHSA|nr:toxin-antitoxin (TA) system antitoxin [Aphanothece sacrum]GBF81524.1 prevent-host-death family protein [Aphanothece sacrum FPU1]GBF86328.1 prevent-host-death family protein [Aphanothece sacrum FPU3]